MYTGLIVFLGTDDLDATDLFYRKDLGLSIYKQQPTCTIYQVTEQSAIGFCSHLPMVREKKNPILTLLVEDVQKTYKELQKKGVRTHTSPTINSTFQIEHFFLEDNNGYTVEIQSFL